MHTLKTSQNSEIILRILLGRSEKRGAIPRSTADFSQYRLIPLSMSITI